MPLIQSKSKKAFSKNVATEMDAGKPQKQSLAIAYSVKRKPKKMAKGGLATALNDKEDTANTKDTQTQKKESNLSEHAQRSKDSFVKEKEVHAAKGGVMPRYAKGGQIPDPSFESNFKSENRAYASRGGMMTEDSEAENLWSKPAPSSTADVHPSDFMHEEERAKSIAHAIINNRKKMADGGIVDLEANSEESPNMEDKYSFEANGKEQFDDSQLSPQPTDSNETGDSQEDESENKHDMISSIRKHLKAKRGM